MDERADLTLLLDEWSRGDAAALDTLTPLVYPKIQSIAHAFLRRGGRWGLLQTTDVVNDLFLKLLAQAPQKINSRKHFFALCARMIRHALVDHCRANLAGKRGGSAYRVPLHEDLVWVDASGPEMIALDRALAELESLDPQQADLFSMRFLLGCTAEETADLSKLSKATVDRKVRLARIWLFQKLNDSAEPESPAIPHAEV
jgi:RNA polymerase sigma factor (TIGR02999 family)